jgi:hypothetical protein
VTRSLADVVVDRFPDAEVRIADLLPLPDAARLAAWTRELARDELS